MDKWQKVQSVQNPDFALQPLLFAKVGTLGPIKMTQTFDRLVKKNLERCMDKWQKVQTCKTRLYPNQPLLFAKVGTGALNVSGIW